MINGGHPGVVTCAVFSLVLGEKVLQKACQEKVCLGFSGDFAGSPLLVSM
jgi:hypothetical protein